MTRNKLLLSGTGIAAAGLILVSAFGYYKDNRSLYRPSEGVEKLGIVSGEEAEEFHGAAEWSFNRMKNEVTGQIDPAEVISVAERARHSMNNARNAGPQQTSSVNWNELGPDNVGGRTRAIIIDRNNSQHMFAGGVSGGLWESNDGANNWHRVQGFFSVTDVNICVTTIAQAPNGDLYVGTGEGNFYSPFGTGAGGFIGGGIYKSTDGGVTWALLANAAPTTSNSTATAWANVNKIAIDPNNSQNIYAATNKGCKNSTDGGATWASITGPSASGVSTDVEIASNGNVIAVVANKPWLGTTALNATFVNVGNSSNGFFAQSPTRTEIAIAPSDPNYVYAFCAQGVGSLLGLAVSTDGGNNWTIVTGAGNSQFDPFSSNSQGTYDNCITIDPTDKTRAIIGGVELWEWKMIQNNPPAGQWTRIALEFPASPFNPYYVHSDKHIIVFNPTTPTTFFVGCDGGVFRTLNNGQTYQAMNSGYNVTQCYAVAYSSSAGNRNVAMAGCQDNGTQYVDGYGNTSMSAAAVGGGDGGQCEISWLNPQAIFGTVYYGALARSNNGGASSSQFYTDRITGLSSFEQAGFASFVTPIRLWESSSDMLSRDSVKYQNNTRYYTGFVTDGSTATYTGVIPVQVPNFPANPAPTVVLSSVRFGVDGDTLNTDAAGNIVGNGTGTVGTNGTFSITFNTTPAANKLLRIYYDVTFSAGTQFTVNSNVSGKTIDYTSSVAINPGEWLKVQDVIQSRLAVGFSGNNGIWITRRPLDFSTNPEWIKVGGTHSLPNAYSGEAEVMAWSADGNHLFVGTNSGNLYRFSNLGMVTDSANGDIDNGNGSNPNCQTSCTLIGSFSGRWVTGVDCDPNDPERVIVSLGNYSNTNYVYFSSNAVSATSVASAAFVDKTGNLDNIGGVPTYSVTFDKYVNNRVLVGTEHGVYETSNITAASVSWSPAMTGLDNVVIDAIRQQRLDAWLVPNSGCFYIGTHGRGMWRDDSSWQQPTGISNPSQPGTTNTVNNNDLRVFPNPVVDNSNVSFILGKSGDATVQIFDLNGKVVYSKTYQQLSSGANTVQLECSDLAKGTYIVMVSQDARKVGTGRFIKMN